MPSSKKRMIRDIMSSPNASHVVACEKGQGDVVMFAV